MVTTSLVGELYRVLGSGDLLLLGPEVPSLLCSHGGPHATRTEQRSQVRKELFVQFSAPPVVVDDDDVVACVSDV
jgi:hypothetical protein